MVIMNVTVHGPVVLKKWVRRVPWKLHTRASPCTPWNHATSLTAVCQTMEDYRLLTHGVSLLPSAGLLFGVPTVNAE